MPKGYNSSLYGASIEIFSYLAILTVLMETIIKKSPLVACIPLMVFGK